MSWMVNGIRFVACSASVFTLVMSPVAQGAAVRDQRTKLQQFVKWAGYGAKKPPTVGEFYAKVRNWYPQPMREQMDTWATLHRDEPMPKIDIQEIKDTEGKTQLRVFFQKEGKSFNITAGDDHVKVNAVKVTAADYKNFPGLMKRLAASDPVFKKSRNSGQPLLQKRKFDFVLSREAFSKLTPEQKASYFLTLRRALEDAEIILNGSVERKTSFLAPTDFEVVARWLVGEPAFAAGNIPARATTTQRRPTANTGGRVPKVGDTCIVAGYGSKYGENLSCGGQTTGRQDFVAKIDRDFSTIFSKAPRCSGGSFPCNPLVYGFDAGGSPHCISQGNMKYATRDCNSKSPLNGPDDNANRQRIVQSWVKAMGKDDKLEFNEKGELKADQYDLIAQQLGGLRDYINNAVAFCDSDEGKKLQGVREDQKSACDSIRVRAFALDKYNPAPPVPPAPICEEEFPGSRLDKDKCVCDPPKEERNEGGQRLCAEAPITPPPEDPPSDDDSSGTDTRPEKPPKKEETDYTWLWVIGGIAGLALLDCFVTNILLCKKKSEAQTPVYVPPVPPPLPPPDPDPPTNPPIPPQPTGETGTGTPPINSGGVNGNR